MPSVGHREDNSLDDEYSRRLLIQAEKDRYLLFHRRFAYLSPNKIRNLYKVTTLKKPIRVPKNTKIYKVYSLTKLRNKIPKTISP